MDWNPVQVRSKRVVHYDYPRGLMRVAARRRRLRRRAVLDVSAEHFAREGFYAASVEAIALEVRTSKPQIYDLFPSKLDLLDAVLVRERRKLEERVVQPLTQGETSREDPLLSACLAAVQLAFEYHIARPHSLRVLFGAQNWRLATGLRQSARDAWTDAVAARLARHAPIDVGGGSAAANGLARLVVTCTLGVIECAYDQRMSLLEAHDVAVAAMGAIADSRVGASSA
jgi:TetR/AcrR family transcriptional regulator, mexJK operon transcriptional repressor